MRIEHFAFGIWDRPAGTPALQYLHAGDLRREADCKLKIAACSYSESAGKPGALHTLGEEKHKCGN